MRMQTQTIDESMASKPMHKSPMTVKSVLIPMDTGWENTAAGCDGNGGRGKGGRGKGGVDGGKGDGNRGGGGDGGRESEGG